ncbi:glucokinase [Paucibacter sp. B2R-40]|uniref:glucokinase n=1 Tax=Paucibacter sp. B2R-40 TaxID=2893554 RepID=UPI0021E440CD|nr:glucokinase [Paucibacter sp. B2R-40]MCV2356342.1 glucokinase [Paucibacter sp. B2R-40]
MIEIGCERQSQSGPSLLGDVGGSNVRLAWQREAGAAIERVQVMPCADYPNLTACIQNYLSGIKHAGLAAPRRAALGVATPVLQDQISLTNRDWAFSARQMLGDLGLQRLVVMNDFTALALAIPALPQADFWHCGGPESEFAGISGAATQTIAVLGPGTGLGVSGLVSTGDRQWTALQTEGGHVSLSAHSERECRLIAKLACRFGHVSAERVLSGPGLVNMVEALCDLDGVASPEQLTPAAVIAAALGSQERVGPPRASLTPSGGGRRRSSAWGCSDAHPTQAQCAEALDLFAAFLGDVAGDLVLSLGARGGAYIGGGIVPRLGAEWLRASRFRARFEAKGRMAGYLASVSSYVIAAQEPPALLGASRAL